MGTSLKKEYEPPTVDVNPVALENNIAQQSPVRSVDVNPWQPDTGDEVVRPDTGDIYLPI